MKRLTIDQMAAAISCTDPVDQIKTACQMAESTEESLLILAESYGFKNDLITILEQSIKGVEPEEPDTNFLSQIKRINEQADYLQALLYVMRLFAFDQAAKAMLKLFTFTEPEKTNDLVRSIIELKNKSGSAMSAQMVTKLAPVASKLAKREDPEQVPAEIINDPTIYRITYTPVYLEKYEKSALKMVDNNQEFLGYVSNELDEFQTKEKVQELQLDKLTGSLPILFRWQVKKHRDHHGSNVMVEKDGAKRRLYFLAVDKQQLKRLAAK